jgi:hypothetical protein
VSWDVYLFNGPPSAGTVEDVPDDFDPPPLGAVAEVLARLRDAVPDVDLADPEWGRLAGPTWSIELNIGAGDPVGSMMLHVRGTGDDVLPAILRIAAAVGCRALDVSTGDFLTGDPGQVAGWHGFQAYRDQVLGS